MTSYLLDKLVPPIRIERTTRGLRKRCTDKQQQAMRRYPTQEHGAQLAEQIHLCWLGGFDLDRRGLG